MADRRPDTDDTGRAKRQKTNGADMDPKANPYLAHMYDDDAGYSNGYSGGKKSTNNAFAGLTRHQTTAAQANAVEDGPSNPFTGRELSKRYFSILKTRRTLPVHQQRCVTVLDVNYLSIQANMGQE
jgi:pre-mRNA-splicing factor ATP-dependent RNA helicase DHX15/PRP43